MACCMLIALIIAVLLIVKSWLLIKPNNQAIEWRLNTKTHKINKGKIDG